MPRLPELGQLPGQKSRRVVKSPRAAFGVTPQGAMLAARLSRFRGILG